MGSIQRWWALNLILQSAIFIGKNRIASLEAIANKLNLISINLLNFRH